MLERCRLFLLIAVGATVLATAIAVASSDPITPITIVTASAAFTGLTGGPRIAAAS
jgi:hypothetical protein